MRTGALFAVVVVLAGVREGTCRSEVERLIAAVDAVVGGCHVSDVTHRIFVFCVQDGH